VSASRLSDYLSHMQQAVIMSLVIIGEAATKLMDSEPGFIAEHPEVPWRSMRGMRNRMAHGYFDINLDVVWDTLQTALPELLKLMPGLHLAAAELARKPSGKS
jgi:uncharacterized protein with HEPN domain